MSFLLKPISSAIISAVFYKDVRRRPFFYSWDGNRLHKKWLGSFFTEWDLVDITFGDYYNLGYDVAAVLEKNQDVYRIGIYQFIGFGFENMKTIDSGDGSFRSQIDLLFEK
jgi:hypothetical protein